MPEKYAVPSWMVAMLVLLVVVGACGSTLEAGEITVMPGTTMVAGQEASLVITASGSEVQFRWETSRGALSSTTAPSIIYTAPESPGPDTVTVRISDESGAEFVRTIAFQIVAATLEAEAVSTLTLAPEAVATPLSTLEPSLTEASTTTPSATRTPSSAPEVTPTLGPNRLDNVSEPYNAARMEGWPAYCQLEQGTDGKPIYRGGRDAIDSYACWPHSFSKVVDDFKVEWTVRIDGLSALLQAGQADIFYWIELRPSEEYVYVNLVRNGVYEGVGEWRDVPVNVENGAVNTASLVRIGSTLSLTVNGQLLGELTDVLFAGEPIPIRVGFGYKGNGIAETSVELVDLRISAVEN